MKQLFSEPEPTRDLTHGVTGVEWHSSAKTSPKAAPTGRSLGHRGMEDGESYVLFVGIVAAFALFLRLAVLGMGPATDLEAAYTPSTPIELQLAEGIASEFRYGVTEYPEGSRYAVVEAARSARGERQPLEGSNRYADAYHAPGYPAVLAAFVKTGLDMRWLLLLQCLIAAGTTLVAYRVALMLIGRKPPALLVSALIALHPALIVAPAALSGGVIAVALLMLGLWTVSAREDSEPLIASAGGLSLGVSTLFNPLLIWTAPLVALWLMLSGRRAQSLVITGAMLLGFVGPPAFWMYRNANAGMGATLTRAPVLERYMGVLGILEAPLTAPNLRDTAMLDRLPAVGKTGKTNDADATDLFSQIKDESRWRLREQGNAYLQLGNDRALRTLVGHSAEAAFTRLKLNYTPSGSAAAWLGETAAETAPETPDTANLAAGWVVLNFLLLAATIAGAVALLWRRHIHEAGLLLAMPLAVVIGCVSLPGESERLPLFALQILLIGGTLSPAPLRVSRRERKSRRPDALRLERISAAPGPGGPLAPLGAVKPAEPIAAAPPSPAAPQQIHPMLRGPGTSEMGGGNPPPGRLV